MTRWIGGRVLVIGVPVVEVVLLIWLASVIGWGWTLLILLAGLVAGVALMRTAGGNAFRAVAEPLRRTRPYVEIDETTGVARTVHPAGTPTADDVAQAGSDLRESGMLFVAGLLLAVPGLITDVTGIVVALPPVRRVLARRLAVSARRSGVVVQGETVVVDTEGGVHVQRWDSAPQPPTIRGELLPPSSGR